MSAAEVSMILDEGLTPEERAKFKRVENQFSALFTASGRAVRGCYASVDDDGRKINFCEGFFGDPVAAFPADEFVAATETELLQGLQQNLERRVKPR